MFGAIQADALLTENQHLFWLSATRRVIAPTIVSSPRQFSMVVCHASMLAGSEGHEGKEVS